MFFIAKKRDKVYNKRSDFLVLGVIMQEDNVEQMRDVLDEASETGAYPTLSLRPRPLKKKKKKKKPFPTDPDDPETDDLFDEEDDDDDDDSETDGEVDSDTEDENELKQEVKKKESFFRNPFQFFKNPENMALKKGDNPIKQERSPVQKFIDVLLYGVEGARIRNGELPRQNIADELLLGLGFKAYLKDVLLGRQAAKFWKQKVSGKENMSLLKTGLKNLKKQAKMDPAALSMVKSIQKELTEGQKKGFQQLLKRNEEERVILQEIKTRFQLQQKAFANNMQLKKETASMVMPVAVKTEQSRSNNEAQKVKVSEAEMRKLMAKVEKDERRIQETERQSALASREQEKQILRDDKARQEKQIIQAETNKEIRAQASQKSIQQNDKDQLLMQRNEMMMQQRSQQSSEMNVAALQGATRLAMAQVASQMMQTQMTGAQMAQAERHMPLPPMPHRGFHGEQITRPVVPPAPAPVQKPSQENSTLAAAERDETRAQMPPVPDRQAGAAAAIAANAAGNVGVEQAAEPKVPSPDRNRPM